MAADASEKARIIHRVIRLREGGLSNLSLHDIEATANSLAPQAELAEGMPQLIGGQDAHPLSGVIRALAQVEDKNALTQIMNMTHEQLLEAWSELTAEHNREADKTGFNKAVKSQNKDLAAYNDAAASREEEGEWTRSGLNV